MINLSELKETFECNLDDIKNDAQLVNEYLVDDMMLGLGYNKKKDRTIKRLVDAEADWLVPEKLVVKVYEVEHDILSDDNSKVFEFAAQNKVKVVMLTSGDMTHIFLDREEAFELLISYELSKAEEITENQKKVLDAISNSEYSLEKLDEIYTATHVTEEQLREAFKKCVIHTLHINIDSVRKDIKSDLGVDITDEQLDGLVEWFKQELEPKTTSEVDEQSTHEDDEQSTHEYEEQSTHEVDELKKSLEEIQAALAEAVKEKESIKESLDEAVKEKAEIEIEFNELRESTSGDIERLKSELEEAQGKLDELDKTDSSENSAVVEQLMADKEGLDEAIKSITAEKARLEEQLAVYENTAKEKADLEETNNNLVQKLETVEIEKETLSEKVKELESSLNAKKEVSESETAGLDQSREDSYISQIEELSDKVAKQSVKIKELKKKIEDDRVIIENMEGTDEKAAKRLLESIEVDPDSERTYIAVINKELIQFDELHTFTGRALQELYKIKRIDAQRYIFSGGVFTLVQPAARRDLVMESKAYDLDIEHFSEDEVLNKLRVLFSHFPDVIFMCKKAGKLEVETITEVEEADFGGEQFNESDADDFGDMGDMGDFDLAEGQEQFTENSLTDESHSRKEYMLVSCMKDIDDLIWIDHDQLDYEFSTVKYIGTNDVSYDVNRDCMDITYEQLCCKMIDAVLAIETGRGRTEILAELRAMDLSNVNSLIKLCTEEYKQYPRINGTRFVVQGVENVPAAITIVHDICNYINVPQEALWVYIQASAVQNQLFNEYQFPEESIQLVNTEMFNTAEVTEHHVGRAVIKGDALGKISITKRSLDVHRSVIKNIVAVKTPYISEKILSIDDLVGSVTNMIGNAIDNGILVDSIDFGTVIGDSRKLLSMNEMLVGENSIRIDVRQYTFYLADLEPWQVVYALIKLHQVLFRDNSIAVLLNIDLDALQYYLNEFKTSEPSTSLAVKGFVSYVRSQIKQTN